MCEGRWFSASLAIFAGMQFRVRPLAAARRISKTDRRSVDDRAGLNIRVKPAQLPTRTLTATALQQRVERAGKPLRFHVGDAVADSNPMLTDHHNAPGS
jgi:hypothetical protein